MIENTAKQTQEQAMALANALGTKIDFYEYQNLRDQLAQERTKNVVLENRVYSDAKFNALERQNEAMFGVLKSEALTATILCSIPNCTSGVNTVFNPATPPSEPVPSN